MGVVESRVLQARAIEWSMIAMMDGDEMRDGDDGDDGDDEGGEAQADTSYRGSTEGLHSI
jgi:hypothetical protein